MAALLDQTYRISRAISSRALVAPIARAGACAMTAGFLAVYPGTGGRTEAGLELKRERLGYRVGATDDSVQVASHRSAAENVATVLEIFRPTISEFASLFGVSRQTVYNWQKGEPPSAENEIRLADLARAAELFDDADVAVNGQALRRKAIDGKSLLDVFTAGGDVKETASTLVAILRAEDIQRARLAGRLAGKKRGTEREHFGIPMLDENA